MKKEYDLSQAAHGRFHKMGATLLFIAVSPLLIVLILLLLIGLPFYLAYRFLLRFALEVVVSANGRRILLVYSRSPVWQEYIETNWLPLLADHAMVLNWSDRESWKQRRSFAVWVFRHWAPPEDFNPMAIVFPRFRPAKRIGFFYAFRDWKHGKNEALRDAEKQLFVNLGEVRRRRA
jgi:hypothetical protein